VWELAYEEKLTALHKHALQLGLAKTVDEVTEYTLDAMEFTLGFDLADMTLVEDKYLKIARCRGPTPALRNVRLDGQGITVKAANTRTTLRIRDTRREPAYVDGRGLDWKGPPTTLSELAVPVVVDGDTVAVLNVESYRLDAFSVEDQHLLEILAFHVGTVFRRMKHERKLMALHEHAFLLNAARDINEIAKHTLDTMEFALGLNYADIRTVDEGWLRCRGARGMPMLNADLPLDGPGVTVLAANSKKTVRVQDTRKETCYVDRLGATWKGAPTMLSELAVPVIVDQKTAAVLNVENAKPESITDDDQTLMETLAVHVASAITRLRHEDELRRYSERLESLVGERTRRLRENEVELRTTKERLEYLVASNPAVIYSGKPLSDLSDWVLTYVSDRVNSMLGYSPEEFVGNVDFWRKHVHPNDLQANPGLVQELWKKGHITYAYQFRHKDGDYRWVREEAIVTYDADGTPIEVNGYWIDVTALKRAEQALAASEKKYRELFTASPVSLWEEDFSEVKKHFNDLRSRGVEDLRRHLTENPDEISKCAEMVKILSVNEATLQLYGAKNAGEFIGGLDKVVTPEFQETFRDELVALSEGRTPFTSEFDNRTLTGDVKHVNLILTVAPGYEDSLAKVLVSIIDLTERKKMEEEARKSKDRLEHVLATNPAVLYFEEPLSDFSDTYPTFVSESAKFVLGYEPHEFLGEAGHKFWQNHLHPDDLARYRADLPSLWEHGHHTFEYRFLHGDGTYRWLSEHYRAVLDSEGHISHAVSVAVDVTERKQLQEKLAKAERLAAIGETASMVGHDLRNPLQGIAGATYILRNDSLTSEQRDQMLQLIDDNVRHADRIVAELLDYSREIRLTLATVAPRKIVGKALEAVKVPSNVRVQDLSQEGSEIAVDSEKIQRVLVNLMQNAVDAMPSGGTLTISSRESNEFVEIDVTDTGTGVAKEIMLNLWKPLHTTKARGMGLGLPIVKRIVEAHRGRISVTSEIGKGTTFTIQLPK
jgi:PAS domain S-box-containing protein